MARPHITSPSLETQGFPIYNDSRQIGKVWKCYRTFTDEKGFWSARWYWGDCGEGTVKPGFYTREDASDWVQRMEKMGIVPEFDQDGWERVTSDASALVAANMGHVPPEIWGNPLDLPVFGTG